jgi:hypothetical protein
MAGWPGHLANVDSYAIIRDNLRAQIDEAEMRNVVDKANWF